MFARSNQNLCTYHTNLSQRTDISLPVPHNRSILLFITHLVQRIRVYITTTELVWVLNWRRFTAGGGDKACTSEGAFE